MKDTDTAVQLNKIQDEITQDLLQRIREAKEEQKSLKREHNEIISEKEIKLKELCSEQGSFKREEGKVNLLEEERTKLTSLRSKMESDNLVNEKKLDENLLKLRYYYAKRQGLRDEFNALLHKQIGYEARRVQIAGDLSCEKEAKNKLESDIKAIIENKKVQDLYLDSLTIRMEHLNQTMMEYSSQCGAMVSHSKEIESLIRNAEQDISQITTDKRKIMQAWNLAIINIGKRDETIAGFNEALDEKHILIKSTIASTEKAKSEVISIQNRHEYLTAVQMRHINRKDCFESCLYSVKSRIKESHLELANVTKVKERTLASYYNTSKELQEIERNNENILNEIQNLENARRLLMDEIFEIINVESKSKKSTRHIKSIIHELRHKSQDLESTLSQLRRAIHTIFQDIINKACNVKSDYCEKDKLHQSIQELDIQRREMELKARKLQGTSDKNRNIYEMRCVTKQELNERRDDPLEDDVIHAIREEIKEIEVYNGNAKTQWLKCQTQYISKLTERDEMSNHLNDVMKKVIILREKRRKMDLKLNYLESKIVEVNKKIGMTDRQTQRLNKILFEEKIRIDNLKQSGESHRSLEAQKIYTLSQEIDAISNSIHKSESELDKAKLQLMNAENELFEWEERLKACKETFVMNEEKNEEMEQVKAKIHRLTLNSETLGKKINETLSLIKESMDKRGNMVDRLQMVQKQHTASYHSNKRKVLKTLEGKKLNELKICYRKLLKLYSSETKKLNILKEQSTGMSDELSLNIHHLRKIDENIKELTNKIARTEKAKDSKLRESVYCQNKIKWFQALEEGKYRIYTPANVEETIKDILERVKEENLQLRESLLELTRSFPQFHEDITHLANTLE